MTSIQARTEHVGDELARAARRLYEAEVALHDAHGTGVDAWIAAASERLHDAVVAHLSAAAH